MLKKFFLNMLSSFVGAAIAIGLFIVASVFLVMGLLGNLAISSSSGIQQVKSKSILMIELDGAIEEREFPKEPDIASVLRGDLSAPQTLDVISEAIKESVYNDNIVAIYLKCGGLAASPATLNALRNELLNFKKNTKGAKKIIAYADSYSQGAYYIASVADCIYMNPEGELNLHGLGSESLFFKNLFDKLGVEFQVFKVGTYKSAVEPYIREEMSEPAKAQLDTLFSNMWGYIRTKIAENRKKVTAAKIDSLINLENIAYASSDKSVKAGLVDSLVYERQIKHALAVISGREADKLNFVSPSTLVAGVPWSDAYSSKNQIAVLFASGEIADGNSNEINFEDLVPVITRLADDDKVKGLVLRVNSPGGSVFGSAQIGEALDYFKSKGKPLAVSMGDYAASGGYWISAGADKIFADPLTITGSIGIFGLIPNFKETMKKIGINDCPVYTNPSANFPSIMQPMDASQMDVMQKYVERGYAQFINRVAKGRKMKPQDVERIAEGRVWDAVTAKKIGLVDSLGGLNDAINWTAVKAGVSSKYDISSYPMVEPTIWSMMRMNSLSMSMGDFAEAVNNKNMDLVNRYILKRLTDRHPVQAKMIELKVTL